MSTLDALLRDRNFSLDGPGDLLHALALVGESREKHPALFDALTTALAASNVSAAVAGYIADTVPEALAGESRDEESQWLHAIEQLDLAVCGARALNTSGATSVAATLDKAVRSRGEAVRALRTGWWHDRVGRLRVEETGRSDLRPWSWLRDAVSTGLLSGDAAPETREELFEAWSAGALGPSDDAALRAKVGERGSVWGLAWHEHLARHLASRDIDRGDLSLELFPDPVIFRLALPHLRAGEELRVVLTDHGTSWRWSDQRVEIPAGASRCRLTSGRAL